MVVALLLRIAKQGGGVTSLGNRKYEFNLASLTNGNTWNFSDDV